MKKILLLAVLALTLAAGTMFAAGVQYNDLIVKNFGEYSDVEGYSGVLILVEIDENTRKWCKLHPALDQERILALLMYLQMNNYKATMAIDGWASSFPVIETVKLNAPDFE